MARRPSITDEQILDAARRCFEERGLHVTTAEIAREAGVSEGSIFRRFPTKTDLFHAAMALTNPVWFDLLDELQGEGDLRENLTEIVLAMAEDFERVVRRFAMAMAFDPEKKMEWKGNEIPIRVIGRLSRFFEIERRAGRIASVDPEMLARIVLGSVHHYTFAEIHGLNDFFPMPRRTFARGVVEIILSGVETQASSDGEPPR